MKNMIFTVLLASLIGCGHKDETAKVDALDGTKWVSACSESGKIEIAFAGGINDNKSILYSDTDCATKRFFIEIKRAYSLSDDKIDYTYQSVMMTIVTQDDVDNCNSDKCWGLEGWTINVAKDIAGRTEGDSTNLKVGDKFYNIFKINGDIIHFGDTSKSGEEGNSEQSRPADLDTTDFHKI